MKKQLESLKKKLRNDRGILESVIALNIVWGTIRAFAEWLFA